MSKKATKRISPTQVCMARHTEATVDRLRYCVLKLSLHGFLTTEEAERIRADIDSASGPTTAAEWYLANGNLE